MSDASIYHVENGKCYILVDNELVGREKQNLILAIRLAREKVKELEGKMNLLDESSAEYDELQDEKK